MGIQASLCNFSYLQIFVKAKFTVVKFNSKISTIYHQIKFRKGIMDSFSIKMTFLKISLYSHENNSAGVCFLKKKCKPSSTETLLKCSSNTGVFLWTLRVFKNICFKDICERLFEGFATWANNITSNRKWRRHFSKRK